MGILAAFPDGVEHPQPLRKARLVATILLGRAKWGLFSLSISRSCSFFAVERCDFYRNHALFIVPPYHILVLAFRTILLMLPEGPNPNYLVVSSPPPKSEIRRRLQIKEGVL